MFSSEYSIYLILSYFFLYSFLGWCLEVIFCTVTTGKFVNRGFLNGPVCPIYGFGATFVILLLTPLQSNILLLFIGSVIVTSLLELITGYLLKVIFHTSWWDYSDQPFNLGGFICLKFSLAWGIACVFLLRVLHPLLNDLIQIIPKPIGILLLILFSITIILDLIITVLAINKMNRDLVEISKLTKKLRDTTDELAHSIGSHALNVAEKIDGLNLDSKKQKLTEEFNNSKLEIENSLEKHRENLEKTIGSIHDKQLSNSDLTNLKKNINDLISSKSFIRERLIRAFPRMKSHKYREALQEILKNRKK